MAQSHVSFAAHNTNNNQHCLQKSSLGFSKLGERHYNAGHEDDDDCSTATTVSLTSSNSYTTYDQNDELSQDDNDDDAWSILPLVEPHMKSVHFALEENQMQIFEYNRKERAAMWYTQREKETQRQEEEQAIELLQDHADYSSSDGATLAAATYPRAEVIANHRYNTSTRGLEHCVSSRVFRESSQRKKIVRLSVLSSQQHVPEFRAAVQGRKEEVANAARFALDYSTTLALERAAADADYVGKNVW